MDEYELIQSYLAQQKPPILDDIVPDGNEFVPDERADAVKSRLIASVPFRSGVIDID